MVEIGENVAALRADQKVLVTLIDAERSMSGPRKWKCKRMRMTIMIMIIDVNEIEAD